MLFPGHLCTDCLCLHSFIFCAFKWCAFKTRASVAALRSLLIQCAIYLHLLLACHSVLFGCTIKYPFSYYALALLFSTSAVLSALSALYCLSAFCVFASSVLTYLCILAPTVVLAHSVLCVFSVSSLCVFCVCSLCSSDCQQ